MKKALIIVVVIAVALLVGKYVVDKRSSLSTQTSSTPGFQANRQSSPGVDESGTYVLDTKASSAVVADIVAPIKNGSIVFQNGSIVGGTALMNLSNLKNSKFFDLQSVHLGKNDGTLAIKALVFDRAQSTNEHVVFRTDAELTMNGITKPVSFTSSFQYRPGYMVISGTTMPDWKSWGLVTTGPAPLLSVTLVATK